MHGDAPLRRRETVSREVHEDGAAPALAAGPVIVAEDDDDVVEVVLPPHPLRACGISSLPPVSTIAARALCKRLRARLPSARIIVGLWQPDDAEFAARRERLGKAGADETYPDLRRAAAGLAALATCTLPPGTDTPPPDASSPS